MSEKILKEILKELKNIHYHLDNLEVFYKFVNRVGMKKEEIKEELKVPNKKSRGNKEMI